MKLLTGQPTQIKQEVKACNSHCKKSSPRITLQELDSTVGLNSIILAIGDGFG